MPLVQALLSSYNSGTSYINSVQQVSITIGSGATSNTATITGVGANSFIIFQGFTTDAAVALDADTPKITSRVELTNSTTVTAFRNTSGASVTVNAVVIDPTSSLVTGVQSGTITLSAASSNTATISSVSTSLSAVFFLGAITSSTGDAIKAWYGTTLTNSTTVTASCQLSATATVGYVVVTFATGAIQSIQQKVTTSSSGSNDVTTISAVTVANCMLVYGGYKNNNGGFNAAWSRITSTTAVTSAFGAAPSFTRTHYFTVIEFKSGVLNSSSQTGSIAVSSTSNTATISSVNTAKSICNFTNFTNNSSLTSWRDYAGKITLTNATTVTATKNTAGSSDTSTIGYEVIEFK